MLFLKGIIICMGLVALGLQFCHLLPANSQHLIIFRLGDNVVVGGGVAVCDLRIANDVEEPKIENAIEMFMVSGSERDLVTR